MEPLVAINNCINLPVIYDCFVMQDPCRPGVRDSVGLCTAAGIKVAFVYSRLLKLNAFASLNT